MSSQRYTRWHSTDDDDDIEENGVLTEHRDQDEEESRRAFTLMTPACESQGIPIYSRKLILITALLCIFAVFAGTFMGFYLGWTHHRDQPPPETETTMHVPIKKIDPIPSLHCDQLHSFEDIPAMSMKLMKQLSIYDINEHVRGLINKGPADISEYIKSSLRKYGYTVKSLIYSVSASYHERDDASTVSVLYKNKTSQVISNSFRIGPKNMTFSSFNAYSANGSFSGPLVYGHFATENDLKTVEASNITLKNTILLVRQGKLHPSIQVINAEKFGVKAVILYPDPEDFGGKKNTSKTPVPSLPEDGVITQSLRISPGDPATVGYTSEKYVYRLPVNKFLDVPTIPVQSISASEARLIFSILRGPSAPISWKGTVTLNTFGGSFKPELNITSIKVSVFCNVGISNIKSIHASLPAIDNTKVIHVGTHFDESFSQLRTSAVSIAAWLSFAGAMKNVFPNGTERMVVFSAFPGTQGDYSGGGEYVELMSNWLHTTALAYVDFDNILKGSGLLEARASPLMKKVVEESYHHVEWPNKYNVSVSQGFLKATQEIEDSSNFRLTNFGEIKETSMCGESANFYAKLGIPTLNLAAINKNQNDFYLKNSQYDELNSGIKYLDSNLEWTHMITSLLSVSTMILSNTPLPPVDFEYFARDLKNEWSIFTYDYKSQLSKYKGNFHDIIDAINGELDILITMFHGLDKTYSDESATTKFTAYRKHQENLLQFLILSRNFLRPATLSSPLTGGSLIFGPDVENPCKSVSFPMARKVLYNIQYNESTWNDFEKEVSLILSTISSLHTKMGSHR